jgi:membrane protein DedA with SNARE-associated domain
MLDPAEVAQWLELIRNNTKKVIFFARFVPMIRGPIYFATGMSQLELSKFSKIDYIASLLQLPVLLFLGRWIGTNAGSLIDAFQKIGLLFLILFSWMIAFGMIRKRRSALPKA